jgi:mono/diheme cytochrome c family protein
MNAEHPKVRATAVRVAERLINSNDTLAKEVIARSQDQNMDVRLQVMFTLGGLRGDSAERVMLELLDNNIEHRLMRDATISGLKGRELDFLARALAHEAWKKRNAGREEILKDLAACVAEARDGSAVNALLDMAASLKERWTQYAILDGVATLIPAQGKAKVAPKPKPLIFESEPPSLKQLAATSDEGISKRLATLEPLLAWKGKAGMEQTQAVALTTEEQALFEAGKAQYPLICGACHQPTGLGQDGLAPPLVDSDWVTGSPDRLARIVLGGVRGPLNVKGRIWELEMPPVWVLSDTEIASLLTYVRREWGHQASAIPPEFIAKVRKDTETREEAWTEAELLKIP